MLASHPPWSEGSANTTRTGSSQWTRPDQDRTHTPKDGSQFDQREYGGYLALFGSWHTGAKSANRTAN